MGFSDINKISENEETHALNLHHDSIVVDGHCDCFNSFMPPEMKHNRVLKSHPVQRSLGERSTTGHTDLPRLLEGGVDCQIFQSGGDYTGTPFPMLKFALKRLDIFFSEMEKNMDKINIVTSCEEIIKNHNEKKVSAVLAIEGAAFIDDLSILRIMYKLGLRNLMLVWGYRNAMADTSREKKAMGGLSDFGISVIEEMNKLGMIIDVSHLNDPGFWDIIEVSKNPFIASHSNCRSLCNVPRNLTDEMIKALAEKDGVMGMNFLPFFLVERKNVEKGINVTVETVVKHIDHIVDIVGVDHVGLGSDFDGIPYGPVGLEDVSKMPNITKALVMKGYSDAEIKKILGENFLRLFKNIWKH